jgi:putative transposase
MAHTFTQIHVHLIFAVASRQSLIRNDIKDDLYKYMAGIVQRRGHKVLAINGMPDHVHLLIGFRPEKALSDLVRDLKAFSSKHVNDAGWLRGWFQWQEGFGAFSYTRSHVPAVVRYIMSQEQHHRRRTFREEYLDLLDRFDGEYDLRYVFKWIEANEPDAVIARS